MLQDLDPRHVLEGFVPVHLQAPEGIEPQVPVGVLGQHLVEVGHRVERAGHLPVLARAPHQLRRSVVPPPL